MAWTLAAYTMAFPGHVCPSNQLCTHRPTVSSRSSEPSTALCRLQQQQSSTAASGHYRLSISTNAHAGQHSDIPHNSAPRSGSSCCTPMTHQQLQASNNSSSNSPPTCSSSHQQVPPASNPLPLGSLVLQLQEQPQQPQQLGLLLLSQQPPPVLLQPPSNFRRAQSNLSWRAVQRIMPQVVHVMPEQPSPPPMQRYMAPEAVLFKQHACKPGRGTPGQAASNTGKPPAAAATAIAAPQAATQAASRGSVGQSTSRSFGSVAGPIVAAGAVLLAEAPADAANKATAIPAGRRRRRTTSSSPDNLNASSATSSTGAGGNSSSSSYSSCTVVDSSNSSNSAYRSNPGAHSSCSNSPAAATHVCQPSNSTTVDDDSLNEDQVLMQLQDLLFERGIEMQRPRFGQQRTACPQCQGGSSREDSFSIKLSLDGRAVWSCFRASCGHTGALRLPHASGRFGRTSSTSSKQPSNSQAASTSKWPSSPETQVPPAASPDTSKLQPLSPALLTWFQQRGISRQTLERNGVQMERRYCRALGQQADHVAFPFYQEGHVVNIKYRALPKHFTQSTGGQQVFYGLDDIKGSPDVFIVEGEMDKLAIESATGFTAVLSIPAGAVAAPATAQNQLTSAGTSGSSLSNNNNSSSKQPWPRYSKKLAFVDRAAGLLSAVQHCVIAVDGDAAGHNTAVALAQKLAACSPHCSCWYQPWPASPVGGREALEKVAKEAAARGIAMDAVTAARCKDANDVLMLCGPEVLGLFLQFAPVPFPSCFESGSSQGLSASMR